MTLGLAVGGVTTTVLSIVFFLLCVLYVARRHRRAVSPSLVLSAVFSVVVVLGAGFVEGGLLAGAPAWVGKWLNLALYLTIAHFALMVLDFFVIGEYFIGRRDRYIPDVVRTLMVGAAWVASSLIILRVVLGIDIVALVAFPTVATAVIGVALKDTLSRVFAGIVLGKTIKIGDWVWALGREGVVTHIGLEYVTLVTREQANLAIPNDSLTREPIINYSQPTGIYLCPIELESAYGVPPEKVCRTLIEAAGAVEGVLSTPRPTADVKGFNESGILYRLKFPIGDYARAPQIESQVRSYIWNAFARNGIEFPFSQRVVHTRVQPATSGQQAELDEVASCLRHVDFLSSLDSKQLDILAHEARVQHYLPGERVVRQGDEGYECYVIVRGTADVRLETAGLNSALPSLGEGEFFGELSLLTGETRSATVMAASPLKVIAIGKAALLRVVQEDPGLVERIGEVVAHRQATTMAMKEQLSREAAAAQVTIRTRSLIERIQFYLWGSRTSKTS